jgi:hypothetical protein
LDYAAGIRDGRRGRWNYWVTPTSVATAIAWLGSAPLTVKVHPAPAPELATPNALLAYEPSVVAKNIASRDVFLRPLSEDRGQAGSESGWPGFRT